MSDRKQSIFRAACNSRETDNKVNRELDRLEKAESKARAECDGSIEYYQTTIFPIQSRRHSVFEWLDEVDEMRRDLAKEVQ